MDEYDEQSDIAEKFRIKVWLPQSAVCAKYDLTVSDKSPYGCIFCCQPIVLHCINLWWLISPVACLKLCNIEDLDMGSASLFMYESLDDLTTTLSMPVGCAIVPFLQEWRACRIFPNS